MENRNRSRTFGKMETPFRVRQIWPNRSDWSNNPGLPIAKGDQHTSDDIHSWSGGKSGADEGGNFFSIRRTFSGGSKQHGIVVTNVVNEIEQFVFPATPFLPFPGSLASSDDALGAKGATAIARCSPLNPSAELGVALGEAGKDGLPSIPLIRSLEKRAGLARSAGREFLNATFGWLPLLHDTQSALNAFRKQSELINQYHRDAGKSIRRRFSFPIESQETVSTSKNVLPYFVGGSQYWPQYLPPTGGATFTEIQRRETWFSGCFTYYLPSPSDLGIIPDGLQESLRVFNLRITPDTLWNLAPWSWMVDWVSNSGDVLANVTRFDIDGLVMRYGYIMEHTSHELHVTYDGSHNVPALGSVAPMSWVTSTKKRLRASPYGFGVSWDGLSTFQKAVLGALGLSRQARY